MLRPMAVILCVVCGGFMAPGGLPAACAETVAECQELLRVGQYAQCLEAVTKAIADRSYGEEWPLLKARCELLLGQYPEAAATIKAGIERYSWSVRLRMLEYETALANGQPEQAAAALVEIERLVASASWRYTDADDLVTLGTAALALGADAKDVQEGFFERARRNYKNRPDGFLAAGQLANAKGDFQLAAEILGPAAKQFPDNPDILFALAVAWRSSDREESARLLQQTLTINPQHPAALQQLAEEQIDAEDYAAAEQLLARMLAVNPHQPAAHALQAVIHHLRNAHDLETASRDAALKFSVRDPQVDHLIGRKLSQKYRFAEGAAFQRKALEANPDFADAKIQLAQDLLRLGQEAEGWQLADEALQKDAYNTTVFNLLQLKNSIDRFTTLQNVRFQLRMDRQEAAVYGQQVLELLERAHTELSQRYQFVPEGPIVVEIFPRADDFAVRTFGIPDVSGFLGVCFGRVITANSPATRRESPSSWEAILWHEFCHVITLQMTDNRIPRWLSEGISVYEERRQDSRWGQRMNASFRDRIRQGPVTPVSQLSSAFLTAESGEDLNFAYFESSMVVEHLVAEFGPEVLIAILTDLKSGLTINDALARQTSGLEELETSFAAFLKAAADAYASDAEFDTESVEEIRKSADPQALPEFVRQHPQNVPASLALAQQWLQAGETTQAEALLQQLVQLVPEDGSLNGPRRLLAELYQTTGQADQETQILQDHLQRNADDLSAVLRLQQLAAARSDHSLVTRLGHDVLAIDPFQTQAILRMADAAEQVQDTPAAVRALRSLLELQPDDAARLHLRIARLLQPGDPAQARRHVLLSLQQAPRYREAHRFLLSLQATTPNSSTPDTAPAEATPAAPAPPSPAPAGPAPAP